MTSHRVEADVSEASGADSQLAGDLRPAIASSVKLFYAALILTLLYCFAFVDRQIFNLLVAPMKRDFAASDLQISYLLGPAFILSYVAVGLPAGWCVDRFDRRLLLLGAGLAWSVGTILAAFAQNYQGLFASRLLVGASEAFVYPAGLSFIADLFDRRRLPVATSIFLLAPAVGGGLAILLGGHLLDITGRFAFIAIPLLGRIRGWQGTLLIIGALGLAPVLLMMTIRDTKRDRKTTIAFVTSTERKFGFLEGTVYMIRRWRFYLMFFLGMAGSSLVMVTVSAWAPTYLARTFGLSPAEVGTRYGTLVLIFGIAGCLSGPLINSWLSRWREDSTMQAVRLGPYFLAAFAALLFVARSELVALACLAMMTFSYSFPMGMASASLQVAAPPRLRGVAASYYFVIVSLIGYGIGPTLVPFVAEKVLKNATRIGPAMAAISVLFGVLAAVFLTIAVRGFRIEQDALRDIKGEIAI